MNNSVSNSVVEKEKGWFSGLRDASKKEIQKYIVRGVVILVVSLIIYLFGLQVPDREAQESIAEYLGKLWSLNWKPVITLVVITGIFLLFYYIVRSFLRYLKKLKTDASIKTEIGLINYYAISRYSISGEPKADETIKKLAENQLKVVFKDNLSVDMILVSGYRAIGSFMTPGFAELKASGTYRIFIIDPSHTSSVMEGRTQKIQKTLVEYMNGVRSVLEYLALVKFKAGINVHVWLYKEDPVFQLFKTDEEIWIQSAVAFRSEEAPLCGFGKSASVFSLYWPLERFWERMWTVWGGPTKETDLRTYYPTVPVS